MVARSKPSPAFTAETRLILFEVLEALAAVKTEADFRSCLNNEIQRIFPHEWFVGGIGRILSGAIVPDCIVSYGLPCDYLDQIQSTGGGLRSFGLDTWFASRRPVVIDLGGSMSTLPTHVQQVEEAYRFKNIAGYGSLNASTNEVAYFSFHRVDEVQSAYHDKLLTLLVPSIREAVLRIDTQSRLRAESLNARSDELTDMQRSVLYWLSQGKSNWEISRIMSTSVDNVKYHVKKIYRVLGVANRVEAVNAGVLRAHPDLVQNGVLVDSGRVAWPVVRWSQSGPVRNGAASHDRMREDSRLIAAP